MAKVKLGRPALEYLGFDDRDMEDAEGLSDMRGGSWTRSWAFLESLRDRTAAELTFKQTDWAVKIKDKLEDLRRRQEL